jgi:hypothetical protein
LVQSTSPIVLEDSAMAIPEVEDVFRFYGIRRDQLSSETAAAVAKVEQACAQYRQLPPKQAFLTSLVSAAEKIKRVIDEQSRTVTFSDPLIKQKMQDWGRETENQIQYLKTLFNYCGLDAAEKLHRMMHVHYREKNGVLLVGLRNPQIPGQYAGKVHERIAPAYSRDGRLEAEFGRWYLNEIEAGRDPAFGVVDFLLEFNGGLRSAYGPPRHKKEDRLQAYELFFRNDKLLALYTNDARFNPLEDRHSNGLVRRMPYNSVGDDSGLRLGTDFKKGDAYIVDKAGKFYSYGGNTIHSVFRLGGRVQAAGIVVAVDGKVQAIDNRSGHYAPNWKCLFQAVKILNEKKVFDKEAIVGVVAGTYFEMFFPVPDFLHLATKGFGYKAVKYYVDRYHKKYGDHVPVPTSKRKFIPDRLASNWAKRRMVLPGRPQIENQWDEFFTRLYDLGASTRDADNRPPREEILI